MAPWNGVDLPSLGFSQADRSNLGSLDLLRLPCCNSEPWDFSEGTPCFKAHRPDLAFWVCLWSFSPLVPKDDHLLFPCPQARRKQNHKKQKQKNTASLQPAGSGHVSLCAKRGGQRVQETNTLPVPHTQNNFGACCLDVRILSFCGFPLNHKKLHCYQGSRKPLTSMYLLVLQKYLYGKICLCATSLSLGR